VQPYSGKPYMASSAWSRALHKGEHCKGDVNFELDMLSLIVLSGRSTSPHLLPLCASQMYMAWTCLARRSLLLMDSPNSR